MRKHTRIYDDEISYMMNHMYYPAENGVEKRIECWKIIIPLHDNQQEPFSEEIIDSIKTRIISEFGGLTSYNVLGYWESGKQIYVDKSIEIIVDVPVRDRTHSSSFFIKLKGELMKELKQEKVYVVREDSKSELLSVNEFLQEMGFEIPSDQLQSLTQEIISKLVAKSDILKRRLSYKTLRLERNEELGKILWEREILGIKLKTEIEDKFPKDAVVLSADNLEKYFTEDLFGKPLIIIGDYEYQSYMLDKEKQRYIVGDPTNFREFDKDGEEPLYGPHLWHGKLRTSEFIPTFTGQVLVNYIILRELGISDIKINVGSDGSMQIGGSKLLLCPAPIPDERVQKIILKNTNKAIEMYEKGTIDEIALLQTKVKNRYNEKKAMIIGANKIKRE